MLVSFVDHLERFGCYSMKQQHGTIVGIVVDGVSQYSTILTSLSSFFPCLEYLGLINILAVDVPHFVPLFSSLHKLVSLKAFAFIYDDDDDDEGVLPAVTIPPQHCPSLLIIELRGRASSFLVQSLVLPNINTLTALVCQLASSDLSSLCTGLCQTTSLKQLYNRRY